MRLSWLKWQWLDLIASQRFFNVTTMAHSAAAFEGWSREDLISRIVELEQIKTIKPREPLYNEKSNDKTFDPSAYPRRKIALKFTYHGAHYSGLEHQGLPTRLPTVEGVLFDALVRCHLVDPAGGFQGCGWDRCGRTDKGVSAAAQVVSLWVRSALGEVRRPDKTSQDATSMLPEVPLSSPVDSSANEDGPGLEGDLGAMGNWDEPPTNAALEQSSETTSELPYVFRINRALPPTIRILAWSPVSDDFSARFSCRWRHYKYFFSTRELDISAMQDAASRLVGEHDFRNLCKIDAPKQLVSFTRRILSANVNPVEGNADLHVLDLVGSAFLYNQVRHIMAVLFLVGTRLEHPSIVDALLNTDPSTPQPPSREGEPPPPIVPGKPHYEMADPLPLVLWDTGYDESALSWRGEYEAATEVDSQKYLANNVCNNLQSLLDRSEIHTALDAHFLRAAAKHHSPPPHYFPIGGKGSEPIRKDSMLAVPLGGGTYKRAAGYTPLLERGRNATAEEINTRWRVGKGARKMERKFAVVALQGTERLPHT
ncbi:pseudouridine synthase [Fomitopsis serialis]|uniref:pseudouridine synthase n=1 Tax=Fomitopsis serialis TaxID=139415 RepID=UPI002007DCF5|nr:pseudouridine synthase [Neoantrodia serialis]KAH9922194.1 pseudouridine synthase [Neoantrodia serialis]